MLRGTMVAMELKIGMLFPFRKEHALLTEFCDNFPVKIVNTPYLESNELRSSRGLNNGMNPGTHMEPIVEDSHIAEWSDCNVVVGMDLPSNPSQLFPNLAWFQGVSAGYDHIDSQALSMMGALQTSARGIASPAIAEFVFARLLQIWKKLRVLDLQQSENEWRAHFGSQAFGKTVGIIGLGSIGREVAIRAKAFGMTVLAVRKSSATGGEDEDVDRLFSVNDLDEMINVCDVVVVAAPANEDTRDMFDERRFGIMKNASIFCNIARGMHVVEKDLISALESGHLAAAILDVTRNEPLPSNSPLWSSPNMYLSPHCSVSFDTYEENAVELLVKNAKLFLQSLPLVNVINPTE